MNCSLQNALGQFINRERRNCTTTATTVVLFHKSLLNAACTSAADALFSGSCTVQLRTISRSASRICSSLQVVTDGVLDGGWTRTVGTSAASAGDVSKMVSSIAAELLLSVKGTKISSLTVEELGEFVLYLLSATDCVPLSSRFLLRAFFLVDFRDVGGTGGK